MVGVLCKGTVLAVNIQEEEAAVGRKKLQLGGGSCSWEK